MADSYKDLMKKVYSSYTPEEETFAQKQGYSLNPDADNYFGSVYGGIYDSSIAAADNSFSFTKDQIRQAYGGSVDSAKVKYSRDAAAYQDDYQQSLIANNSAMQQAAGAYGSNQSRLAALGLTGSGYNAQIMQSIYGGYQDANSEAYKQQQANKRLMQQVYGDREAAAYNDYMADNRKNEATHRAAYIDAEATLNQNVGTAYQGIKQDYTAKQQEYKTNATSIAGYIDDGSADAAYIKQMFDQDYITEDVYKAEMARYQAKKAETLAAAVTGAVDETSSAAAWSAVDSAFASGDISKETYNKMYENDFMSTISEIKTSAEYETTLKQLEADREKLGTSYNSVKSALEAKRTSLTPNRPTATPSSTIAVQGINLVPKTNKDKTIETASNNAGRTYEFNEGGGTYSVKASGEYGTDIKTVNSDLKNNYSSLESMPNSSWLVVGENNIVYKKSNGNYVVFIKAPASNVGDNATGFAKLKDVINGKTTTPTPAYTTVDSTAVRTAITGNTADAQKYLAVSLPAYGGKTAQQILNDINNSASMTSREKAQRKAAVYNEIAKVAGTTKTANTMPTSGGGGKKIALTK